jgi:hypothetical protein
VAAAAAITPRRRPGFAAGLGRAFGNAENLNLMSHSGQTNVENTLQIIMTYNKMSTGSTISVPGPG